MLKLEWLFSNCPTCDDNSHYDGDMVAIEDQGIVDTRDGYSYGVVFLCRHCDTVWQITTGVRSDAEALEGDERESYLAMMRAQEGT